MKLCHVTISVQDMGKSLQFYRDIVGLPVNRRFPAGSGREIAFLGDGETEIELIYDRAKTDISIRQDISLGFEVASVQETIDFLRQKGLDIGEVIQPNPRVKYFFVSDPNGLRIQFVEHVN